MRKIHTRCVTGQVKQELKTILLLPSFCRCSTCSPMHSQLYQAKDTKTKLCADVYSHYVVVFVSSDCDAVFSFVFNCAWKTNALPLFCEHNKSRLCPHVNTTSDEQRVTICLFVFLNAPENRFSVWTTLSSPQHSLMHNFFKDLLQNFNWVQVWTWPLENPLLETFCSRFTGEDSDHFVAAAAWATALAKFHLYNTCPHFCL